LATNPHEAGTDVQAEIEALDLEISNKLAYRHSIVQELRKLNASKAALRNELMTLSERIGRSKSKAKDQQTDLARLNSEKRQLQETITALKKVVNELRTDLRAATRDIRLSDGDHLREKLKDLEWKLQTQKLDRAQEKQLVQYIRGIELGLRQWRRAQEISQRLDEKRGEIEALKARLKEIAAITAGMASEMAKLYAEEDRWTAARKQVIRELDDKRADVKELVSKLNETDAEISKLKEIRRAARDRLSSQLNERSREMEKAYRAKIRHIAQSRLAAGEKLTFNEFKLLAEDEE